MRVRFLLPRLLLFGISAYCLVLVYRQSPLPSLLEDSTDPPPLTPEQVIKYVREAEADMDRRRRLVERVCAKHNLGLYRHSASPPEFKHPPTPQYSVFYIDKPHKITWCPIYKAASSTWLHQLLILAGHTEEFLATTSQQLSVLARAAFPTQESDDVEEAFRSTLKLLVVRHPFERLLSAYRDKLESRKVGLEHGVEHFYRSYGRKIVKKFRNSSDTRDEPTFREFVVYLIHEDLTRADDHWIPYYLFCTPCLVRYDVIAHVETMLRDQLLTINLAGLEDVIEPKWRHLTKGHRSGDVAKKYFSQLSRWQVQSLWEKYRLDFELFGYSADKYLDYAIAS